MGMFKGKWCVGRKMDNRMGEQVGRRVVFRIREWTERQRSHWARVWRREWVDAGWGLVTEATEEGMLRSVGR